MKIVTDEKLINKNKKIGQITTIFSLAILAVGLYLSFNTKDNTMLTYSFIALVIGFITSQFGIYYSSRWGKTPRPDEVLNQALKGLDDKYVLYHYRTPVSHLLIGPAGIWILLPYHQGGVITFNSDAQRWKQKGGNLYMKMFAQEALGRPDLDYKNQHDQLQRFLENEWKGEALPPVNAALVFFNEKAVVSAQDAPIPTLPIVKLKDFIRRTAKEIKVSFDLMQKLQNALPE